MAARWRQLTSTAASMVVVAGFAACGSSEKPISEQSCRELAAHLGGVNTTTTTGSVDFDAQREALEEAAAIAKRVDELGGCPNEPTLAK